jgi:chemotaxis regulatin CheY-phosphate phosphatase CheZ
MPQPPAPIPLSAADYDLIEAAVMETGRGRWFLAEYARRNRHSDTMTLLGAIERLEAAIRGERAAQSVDRLRFDLFEMAKAIARAKAEIAAIKPDIEEPGRFGEVTAELDSIVQMTETATSDILAAAEQVQEIAWTLREQGIDPEVCDLINARATDIYIACTFQDLTGQRTGKVIQVLRYLEGRINAMMDIWGLDGEADGEKAAAPDAPAPALMGPSEIGLDQADVDVMMAPDCGMEIETRQSAAALDGPPAAKPRSDPSLPAHVSEPKPEHSVADPLRPILALSPEEKIALFS